MRLDRRAFVRSAATAAAGAAVWPWNRIVEAASGPSATGAQTPARRFKLNYAPHFGMFRQHAGQDLVAQLEFMASEGFTALEDNGLRDRPVEVQEQIGRALARLNMRMGVFVAHAIDWREPSLTSGDEAKREAFLADIRASVDMARRVNATWMTVVPGHVESRPHMDYQAARVVETLKRASAILEPHGLVMVLEPLNTLRNHPGMFLTTTPQAHLSGSMISWSTRPLGSSSRWWR
jgi:hydroxypyruvate isomerase